MNAMHTTSLLFFFLCTIFISVNADSSPYQLIGVEVGARPGAFIDVAKILGQFTNSSGSVCATDSQGWPFCDGSTLLFDERPFGSWLGPGQADDPLEIQPNENGVYQFSFQGKASLSSWSTSIGTVNFNQTTWTTTGTFSLTSSNDIVQLQFSNTQRNSSAPIGSGITNLKVIRPGYQWGDEETQIFTNEFLQALSPFDHFRFMDWRSTNYDTTQYGNVLNGTFGWNDRTLPTDATQQDTTLRAGSMGYSWEYIILLANKLNKDVWINTPISATGVSPSDTSSYIYNLALLFKDGNTFTNNKGLNQNLNIYIEHSNEVWNSGFSQYAWNYNQAVSEVTNNASSNLNQYYQSDPWDSKEGVWAMRLHARRLIEIGQIFRSVFGSQSSRIRPIYAHFTIAPFQYNETLAWVSKVFGPPSNYFWGLAQTHYYDEGSAASNATVQQVVNALNSSSYSAIPNDLVIQQIATYFGLHRTSYEGGSGFATQSTTNIANRITANRDPQMQGIVYNDVVKNWFPYGGELYNYFSLSGDYSRYGCWGLTDNLLNLTTPKYLGIVQVIDDTQVYNPTTTSSSSSVSTTRGSSSTTSGVSSLSAASTTSSSSSVSSTSGSSSSTTSGVSSLSAAFTTSSSSSVSTTGSSNVVSTTSNSNQKITTGSSSLSSSVSSISGSSSSTTKSPTTTSKGSSGTLQSSTTTLHQNLHTTTGEESSISTANSKFKFGVSFYIFMAVLVLIFVLAF